MYSVLVRETWRGKSLYRTLSNVSAASVELIGNGLDLGGKRGDSSYYRFFRWERARITSCDLNADTPDVLGFNLEAPFPVESETQDFVLMMNVLEHLYRFGNCIAESHRVLKDDGLAVGCVPFLYEYHPDPRDYFRYTRDALERLLSESGFRDVRIEPLGCGPVSTGIATFAHVLRWRILILGAYLCAIGADRLLQRIFPNNRRVRAQTYPLGYFFVARK